MISFILRKYSFLYVNDFKKFVLTRVYKTTKFNKNFFNFKKNIFMGNENFIDNFYNNKPKNLLYYVNKSYWSNKKTSIPRKKKLFFENISIKRIKFKPGYSRLWRLSRVALKFLLSLKFQYQQKLTKYLSRFLRLNKFMLVKYNEFKLLNLLSGEKIKCIGEFI
jgi:hypothetical protein